MRHAADVPRLPYVVLRPRGLPMDPLPAIDVPVPDKGVAHAWATLYAHLHGLQVLYAHLGIQRPLGPLYDLAARLTPIVTHAGGIAATRSALSSAVRAVADLETEDLSLLINAQDAGWWIVALQASYALGLWYGLAPDIQTADADMASSVALRVRQILSSVFDRRVVEAIQDAAHGDEVMPFLEAVVEGALILEAPLRGIPQPSL
ncbi:MAG TPA: hypothetical protein VN436_14340 [Holophaga sp.]|nr:hypothetical protein [Holophaga sp.]